MTLGERIKDYRKKAKITQKGLAERIGKTESIIRKYENGTTTPPIPVIDKIAAALGVEPLMLLSNDLKDLKNLQEANKRLTQEVKKMTMSASEIVLDNLNKANITYDIIRVNSDNIPILVRVEYYSRSFTLNLDDMLYISGRIEDNFKQIIDIISKYKQGD